MSHGVLSLVRMSLIVAAAAAPAPTETPEATDVIDPPELEGDATDVAWWVDLATGPLLRTVIIIALAFLVRYIYVKIVDGFVAGTIKARKATTTAAATIPSTAREVIGTDTINEQRRETRATTIGRLLKNVGSVVILTIAALMILGEWGFNLGPLLAGAGVLGVALGFGAQTLVADFLSGVFMLLEDQYGVGDIVDLGEATGTVEDVQLRVTKLRSVDGVVWWVRNGEVVRVGNMSQEWSRAVVDVGVAYDSDIARVRDVLTEVANEVHEDEEWGGLLLSTPEVWGVEGLDADSVTIRVVLQTLPGEQWKVARELRQRVKARFDSEGIEIPFPQRTVWVRNES